MYTVPNTLITVLESSIVKNVANISSPFNKENNASDDFPNVRN